MTYLEKFKQDHPHLDDGDIRRCIENDCPSLEGHVIFCPSVRGSVRCVDCWNREIPENENTEREETTMESTMTTRKTKAELLQDISDLKKQVETLDRYKKYEDAANDMAAMRESFVMAGFTREEAFEMTKLMIQTAAGMSRI